MFKPGEKRPVKYCHPNEWTLTWTGYGQKPKWLIVALDQGITLDQCARAAEEVRARAADIRESEDEARRQVLFCHPDDSSLTWSGYGRKPEWFYAFLAQAGTEEQAAHAAVRAGYRSPKSIPGYIETVTKKQEPHQVGDQEGSPILPPGTPAACSDCAFPQRIGENGEDVCSMCSGQLVASKAAELYFSAQAELPGLPPVPKKRGRPVTGKAKTAAERKRESRERAIRGEVDNYKTFSNYQLCEAITRQVARIAEKDPEFLDSQKWHYDRLIAELNSRVAAI